jgi:hypothetical protein
MNLLQVRTKFVQISGRYDLVVNTTAYADNGANFYINAGQKLLERLVDVPESIGNVYYELAANTYGLSWKTHTRSIQEVWIENGTERSELTKVSLKQLKTEYYDLATSETGRPMYYAVANLKGVETTKKDTLGTFIENVYAESVDSSEYRGIVIVPPADQKYIVQIVGLFKQLILTSDTDSNFWSIEEPDLLLRAALYELESFSRGTENAKNWLSAIQTDVQLLEFDNVDELSVDKNQMEG